MLSSFLCGCVLSGRGRLAWWRHQMETFSALPAICAGHSPVPGECPTQRPVTRGFDVYFDLRPNKRLSKQSLGWWFETLSPPLWRHRNEIIWGSNATRQRWHRVGLRNAAFSHLSHPPWTKWPPIWQTTFSNAFFWMKMIEFWFTEICSQESNW